MTQCERGGLSFETLFSDPLIRLVMDSDGVTERDLIEVLEAARESVAARERQFIAERLNYPLHSWH